MQYAGTIPLEVRRLGYAWAPCESCGVRTAKYEVRLDPPGRARVSHELCDGCAGGFAD